MTNINLQVGLNITATSKKTGEVITGIIQDMSHDGKTMWVESNRDGFPQLFQFDTSLELNGWTFAETPQATPVLSDWDKLKAYTAERVNGTISYEDGDEDYNQAFIDIDPTPFNAIADRHQAHLDFQAYHVKSATVELLQEFDMERSSVAVNIMWSNEMDFNTDYQLMEGETAVFKINNLKPHAAIKKAMRLATEWLDRKLSTYVG